MPTLFPRAAAVALWLPLSVAAMPSAYAQASAILTEPVRQYVRVDAPVVALTNVRVVDGLGRPAREGQTVIIEGQRITAVGRTGSVRVPAQAERLDLTGHTVVPGFVGLHNHTFYMTSVRTVQQNYSAPRLYLAAGVTTIRTTGSIAPYSELNLKRAIEHGETPGPRMLITGPYITGSQSMLEMNRLSGPDDARRVVAYWAQEGVQWFKAYTAISRDELAAAIDEAHKHGIKVTGHLCSVSFREAVELGIDNLEHGFLTNTDWDPQKAPSVCPPGARRRLLDVDPRSAEVQATIRTMVERQVPMTSTLAVYEPMVPDRPPLEDRNLSAMAPTVREEYLRQREQVANMGEEAAIAAAALLRKAMEFEYEFVKAGGVLASGVDPTGYGGALPGFGDQRNYELLLEAGFTPEVAIQILSANGAKVLGMTDLGTIEPGRLADLVVIRGNPVSNPAEIRNVTIVFKDGVGYDSHKLIESVQGQVGIR